MELPASESFASRKSEEVQKKAERELKIEYIRKLEKLKGIFHNDSFESPNWPSFSTINIDSYPSATDTSTSLVPKCGSKIVSASYNCKKNLMQSGVQVSRDCHKIATSSVKDFPTPNMVDSDRKVMPPPLKTVIKHAKSKALVRTESDAEDSFNSQRADQSDVSLHDMTTVIFFNWTVHIHQNNLIVKGKIKGESRIVRSQPIARRLESHRVLSIKSSVYILDGRLKDSNQNLPDYVYDKFCNGFPVDWLNVAEVWKTFIQQGTPVDFRWPRGIADSDDELLSEAPDVFCDSGQKNSANQPSTSSGYVSYPQISDKSNPEKSNTENQTFTVENNKDGTLNSSESFSKVKSPDYLKMFLKKEKIDAIIRYLGSDECTSEFVDRFSELLHVLRYMSSLNLDSQQPNLKKLKLSESAEEENSSSKDFVKEEKKSCKSISHDSEVTGIPKPETLVCHSDLNKIPATSKLDNKPVIKSIEKVVSNYKRPLTSNSSTNMSSDKKVDSTNKEKYHSELQHLPTKKESTASQLKSPTSIAKSKKISVESKEDNVHEPRDNCLKLASWYPNYVYLDSSEVGRSLVFQGSLLDENLRVINENYCSNVIKTRHAENLLETVDNKMIRLVGNCIDTSKIFPEKVSNVILESFKNGCPKNLDEFCENWEISEQTPLDQSESSIQTPNLPKSSRGRTLVPRSVFVADERMREKNHRYSKGRCPGSNNEPVRRETRLRKCKLGQQQLTQPPTKQRALDSSSSESDGNNEFRVPNKRFAQNINQITRSRAKVENRENKRPKHEFDMNTKLLRKQDNQVTMEFTRSSTPFDILSDDQTSIFQR